MVFSPLYGRIAPRSVRLDVRLFRSLRASAFRRAEQRISNALWRPPWDFLFLGYFMEVKTIHCEI